MDETLVTLDIDGLNLPDRIDHTLLRPETTPEMIDRQCAEALKYRFHAVCVNPCYVSLAADLLGKDGPKICSVVGFPLGAAASRIKQLEAERAIKDGAAEIDMVLSLGLFLGGRREEARIDIEQVAEVVKAAGGLLKVIIETGILETEAKIKEACRLCADGGADFVKTCTGFSRGEALAKHVRLMKEAISPAMQVKASGGIRDRRTALAMLEAGASRLGTSSGVQIMSGLTSMEDY